MPQTGYSYPEQADQQVEWNNPAKASKEKIDRPVMFFERGEADNVSADNKKKIHPDRAKKLENRLIAARAQDR